MAVQPGTIANDFINNVFDISLPAAVVDELNKKVGINEKGEFYFDHEGVSGRFGELNGELGWNNGKNKATYENEIENGGWKGVHRYTIGGEDVDDIWKDVFGIYSWATYKEKGEISWDVDFLNMKASLGLKDTKTGTVDLKPGYSGGTVSFSVDAKLGADLDLTDSDATLTIKPAFKKSGINAEDADSQVSGYRAAEIDYQSTWKFVVPKLGNCEDYFVNFNDKSECQLNVKSSELENPIIFKLKNKFAFLKDGSDLYYIKSENRKGDMVPFNDLMYVSFYINDKVEGQAFNAIKRNFADAGNDLVVTVPLVDAIMSEILPAAMAYGGKWTNFFKNLAANPPKSIVKAAYWMDKWVSTVDASTFDVSSVVAASRFGYSGYLNSQAVAETKEWAEFLAATIKKQSFKDLVETREFVSDIANAESEATQKFVLPA